MNNIEMKLNKLINIIRKDTGINNAMDAMEQLSAILLLKYFYKEVSIDFSIEDQRRGFKKLFFELNYFNTEKKQIDFLKFKNVLEMFFKNQKNIYLRNDNWNKIESLLDNIPFRIRSTRILEMLILEIEVIDFDEKLAEAYDKLLESMINDSVSSGAFYSPKELTSAIVKVINPSVEKSIYDPALGTGRFTIEAQKNISKSNLDDEQKLMRVYGQDISPFAYLVGSLNLLLNGIDIKNILLGDSLKDNTTLHYDIILCAAPFGKISDINEYNYRYSERFSNYETIFLKLAMEKLARDGKAALIVPDGFLFNSTREYVYLREELLQKFNLHTILSLPEGVLKPYTGVKLSVLFFNNSSEIEDDIWFYELKTDKPLNKSNQIKEKDFTEFIELFSKRGKSKNSCLVIKQDVLNKKDLSLNIKLSMKIDKEDNFKVLDEMLFLKKEKEKFDSFAFDFNSIIDENKKVNFQKTYFLDDIVTVKSGRVLKNHDIKDEGKYPVYGGNGIRGYYDECTHKGENIIIGRVGAYCGNVHFTKNPVWLTNNSFSLKVNLPQKVYAPYLAHVLRSMNLNKLARGSAQPALSYAKIKDLEIALPSYEQQVELCSWFDKIEFKKENLIKSIELQNKKFNDISKNLIVSNCIPNDS